MKQDTTAKKWIYSFLNKDYDKSYSFWSDDAVINNINMTIPHGTPYSEPGFTCTDPNTNDVLTQNVVFYYYKY